MKKTIKASKTKKNKIVPLLFTGIALEIAFMFFVYSPSNTSPTKNTGNYDSSLTSGVFHGQEVTVPSENSQLALNNQILGSESHKSEGEKRIEVDLTNQKLYAFEGSKKVYSFDVSTGKWGLTPTGEFRVYNKLRYTLMAGGSKELGTYYYLPNVPFTMYFNGNYGIHGAYWHNNFGHPMSHGCVNMRIEDSEKLFYWASPPLPENTNSILANASNPGTKVIVYGVTPNE